MSTETTGDLKLIKPAVGDNINQTIGTDLPANFEKIDEEVTKRVEKVGGKGLSTNDYTTGEKNKLAGIAAEANKTIIVDDLTTDDDAKALSAKQGKALKDDLDEHKLDYATLEGDVNINKFPATNIVTNGNFATTSGWLPSSATLQVSNNELSFTATAIRGQLYQILTGGTVIGNKYYIRALVKTTSNMVRMQGVKVNKFHSGSGLFEPLTVVATESVINNSIAFIDDRASGWDAITVKKAIGINLTTTFGTGKEPTVSEMDELLSKYPEGWFTGSVGQLITLKEIYNANIKISESITEVNPASLNGTTDSDLIDSAIAIALIGNRIVNIPPKSPINGNIWLLDRTIQLPNDFTLILNNCYLKLKNGVNDNIIRTKNVTDLSLGQNINVIGKGNATIDGNGVNQTTNTNSYKRMGLLFFNVNGFKVKGFKVKNTHGWGMSFESGCCYGKINHIDIDQDGLVINQDGIDIRDGCHHIDIDYITGVADDDCIALTAMGNNVMQVVNDGSKGMDIHHINISNISMMSSYCNIIDIICNDGRKTYDINISNVYDTSSKLKAKSEYNAVVAIGNYDFTGYAMIRPAIDGEMYNINIDNINGRGQYLIHFGWFAKNIHISNVTARDDWRYVFSKSCLQHLPFIISEIYIDGVYANNSQAWEGTVFNFLDGEVNNLSAKNVKIGNCRQVIVVNPSASMPKYCHFSNFDISLTSHQVYSVQTDNAKLCLDNWFIMERMELVKSDATKAGQFYPPKEYPNSIIKFGVGMPEILAVDVAPI